eukprot:TRINITY_DN8437_c0_g1_i3.p1 TRINITY_DN8437_c0_g1~~TRINITY_DN8437_c0_g1_i3.p1  ORF type:complete len:160 (+),score=43.50 TRINITY_DN8437_c0_g1_i3:72-551(+)
MERLAVNVYIEVEFCGKTHKYANYVQGCTVEEAYLRWVPAFDVKKNRKRKVSYHMALRAPDGSTMAVDTSDPFPASAEKVVFWSTGAWGEGCVACARLAAEAKAAEEKESRVNSELLDFHRVEAELLPPPSDDPAAEWSADEAPKKSEREEEKGEAGSG